MTYMEHFYESCRLFDEAMHYRDKAIEAHGEEQARLFDIAHHFDRESHKHRMVYVRCSKRVFNATMRRLAKMGV